jgi:histidine triad (HIT) family protein
MKSCLFCKIIEGEIPAEKVFENENVLAFKDIQPKATHHYLFVPKIHEDSLATLSSNQMNVMSQLFLAIKIFADQKGLTKSGYKVQINTGEGGGQIVFHLHLHLLAH